MRNPLVKKLTLEAVKELGMSRKYDIVNNVIDSLIKLRLLPNLYKRERLIIHGLISLGWDMSDLREENIIANNGRRGQKCLWFIKK